MVKKNSPYLKALLLIRRVFTSEPERSKDFAEQMAVMWEALPDYEKNDMCGIGIPVLVFGCDSEKFLSNPEDPYRIFRETAEAMRESRLSLIEGGTHYVLLANKNEVNRAIMAFLEETDAFH